MQSFIQKLPYLPKDFFDRYQISKTQLKLYVLIIKTCRNNKDYVCQLTNKQLTDLLNVSISSHKYIGKLIANLVSKQLITVTYKIIESEGTVRYIMESEQVFQLCVLAWANKLLCKHKNIDIQD